MSRRAYDAIIIGGGHLGLTLGAYLQRSGLKTAIFERRHEEGSAVYTTESVAPGFLHNLHSQFMEYMDWMPFYHDFKLENLGARLIYPEAQAGISFSDGRPPVILYNPNHFELTRKSISQYSKNDAQTLVDLRHKALDAEDVFAMYWYNPPDQPDEEDADPFNTMCIAFMEIFGLPHSYARSSAKSIIDNLFESPELKTLLYRISVEWGTSLEMENMGLDVRSFVGGCGMLDDSRRK